MKIAVSVHPKIFLTQDIICYNLFFIAQLSRSSAYLKTIPIFDPIMTLLQVLCIVYIVLKRTDRKGTTYFTKIEIGVAFLYLAFLVSTVLISQDFKSFLTYAAQAVGATMLGCQLLMGKNRNLLRYLRNISAIFLVINLITMLSDISTASIRSNNFLGYRIAFTPYILLAIFCSAMYDRVVLHKNMSSFTVLVYCIAVLNAWIGQVATGEIILVLLLCLSLLSAGRERIMSKVFNYWVLLTIYAVLFSLIVILSQTVLFQSVLMMFNEDITFNGRTIIWSVGLQYIAQKPLFGYGTTALGDFMITEYYNQRALPAHDEILNILYQGGFFALFFYIVLFVIVGKAVSRSSNFSIRWLVSVTVFLFLCLTITEIQSQKAILFLVLGMAYQAVENEAITNPRPFMMMRRKKIVFSKGIRPK